MVRQILSIVMTIKLEQVMEFIRDGKKTIAKLMDLGIQILGR